MSRLISDIINAPEPHFSHALREYEQASGRSGHDIRLISDITQARMKALDTLNLDKTDTTARELYYSLRTKAEETNDALEKRLAISPTDSIQTVLSRIIIFVDTLDVKRDVWVIKHAVIKSLLQKQPPKKLMKSLGLRSVDSVLKRNNANELLALAYQLETDEWTKKFKLNYKKLHPSDFQDAISTIFQVEQDKIHKLHAHGFSPSAIVVPTYETGTIALVPPLRRFPMDTLALTVALLQSLSDLRIHSSYYRYCSVKSSFGDAIYKTAVYGLPGGRLGANKIGWKALQNYFNKDKKSFAHVEQPQLQHEDILVTQPIQQLRNVLPHTFGFWLPHNYVFMPDTVAPVSMHLMDVVVNASNKVPFEHSQYAFLRAGLWEELAQRYLQHDKVVVMTLADIEETYAVY